MYRWIPIQVDISWLLKARLSFHNGVDEVVCYGPTPLRLNPSFTTKFPAVFQPQTPPQLGDSPVSRAIASADSASSQKWFTLSGSNPGICDIKTATFR